MCDKMYVDYNATTPLADNVVLAITKSLQDDWANPSSSHELGKKAAKSIKTAREQLAQLVGGHADEITFASGGTEINNMVIFGFCCPGSGRVPHVVTTSVEHDSIDLPLKHLQELGRISVTRVNLHNSELFATDIINSILDETALVTVMAANNETGVIMPLEEIGDLISKANNERRSRSIPPVIFHSDGAQIIGKEPINVKLCKLDCFTIVGHKFYGPRIGALWSKVKVPPLLLGGGQERNIRPGTENTPMIVGLGAAAQLVVSNLIDYKSHLLGLRTELERQLLSSTAFKAEINCQRAKRLSNTVNVSFHECFHSGTEILSHCKRILAGVGAACHSTSGTSPILIKSGVSPELAATAIRLSLGREMPMHLIQEIVKDLEQAFTALNEKK